MTGKRRLHPVNPTTQSSTHFTTVDEADKIAREIWSDAVLTCRGGLVGHKWDPYTARENPKHRLYDVVVRCPRCTTLKRFEVSTITGQRLSKPTYKYPPGYQVPKGSGRIVGEAKDWVQLQSIIRGFPEIHRLTAKEAREAPPSAAALRTLNETLST